MIKQIDRVDGGAHSFVQRRFVADPIVNLMGKVARIEERCFQNDVAVLKAAVARLLARSLVTYRLVEGAVERRIDGRRIEILNLPNPEAIRLPYVRLENVRHVKLLLRRHHSFAPTLRRPQRSRLFAGVRVARIVLLLCKLGHSLKVCVCG